MSRISSKPVSIATVTAGNQFVRPGSPPTTGRRPHPGQYFPDSYEISFLTVSGTPIVRAPVVVDVWVREQDGSEVVFKQIVISDVDIPANDVQPPVLVPGNTVAVSLDTGDVIGGDVEARVTWVELIH